MVRLFNKKLRPPGLSPGSLLYLGENSTSQIQLSIIEYSEDSFLEKEGVTAEECHNFIKTPTKTWIQVDGTPNLATLTSIGKAFELHPLALEDILSTGQRSKLDIYQDQILIIVRALQYDSHLSSLKDEQVSIVLGANYLISFNESGRDLFYPVKERLRQSHSRMRMEQTDYLAYALLDTIVDHYFVVLEKVDQRLDRLEEELMHISKSPTLQKVQQAKRHMIILRKAMWPMRDVVNRFLLLDKKYVSPKTQVYLHDVYDHIVQAIDIVEGFRDVVSGMMDIYLSNINIRTNEIMKVLTIVSTIFVPLTFIASLYGMNFDYMPGIHHHWAYFLLLFLMFAIAVAMLISFKRKRWL